MGIAFSSAMLDTLLGYVGDLWTDIKVPVLVIIGVMIGFFIINGIVEGIAGGIFKHTAEINEDED
jgi:hypothetical protein